MTINATMIRERCIIKDTALSSKGGSRILSNRLVIPMGKDNLVVRGQNMHSVARMGARLYKESKIRKLTLGSPKGKEFASLTWDSIFRDTDAMAKDNWISVYYEGHMIFSSGDHHPFLNLIETQASGNEDSYDMNVLIAAETFKAAGHAGMTIDHDSNVALILNLNDEQGRCGLIYRHPRRTTTFSFSVALAKDAVALSTALKDELPAILEVSADFLESIQLCYAIAADTAKGIEQDAEKQVILKQRLGFLRKTIDGFESGLLVTYRPERPDFNRFLQETQLLLAKKSRV